MNLRTPAFAALAFVVFGTGAVSFAQSAAPGTPPPPPVPGTSAGPAAPPAAPGMTPTPTPEPFSSPSEEPLPSPSPGGRGRRGRGGGEGRPNPGPSPTDTPEAPQFSTLDGVWEVALQPLTGARTIYSHLYITQSGNTLTGTWRRTGKTVLPFTGTFDGRLFKLSVTDGTSTELLSGYEENYMDMVGLYTDGDPKHAGTPFTAAHRKRERDRSVNIR